MHIFISYGHDEHVELAHQLKKDLISHGHQVWFDFDRLKPGGDWETYIEEGIEWVSSGHDQGRIILLITPHSVRRPDGYCLNEIARALARQLSIVPVMVVWCEPPLSIERLQWLDMRDCIPLQSHRGNYQQKFSLLLDVLEKKRMDIEGGSARLRHRLEPLSYDAEILVHLPNFILRKSIVDKIDAWLSDANAPRVLWIRGEPGTGKTALSAWLCHYRREIAALHFCKHGHSQKADPRCIVLSIAHQLSTQLPFYQDRLKALPLEELIPKSDAKSLFDILINQPLSGNFERPDHSIIILIDALDEAVKDRNNEMARLIASEFGKTPPWVRLIITSRQEKNVNIRLSTLYPKIIEIGSLSYLEEIHEFIEKQLSPIISDELQLKDIVDLISKKAGSNFLFAQCMCNDIIQNGLKLDEITEFPAGLGGIYLEFFDRAFPDTNVENLSQRGLEYYREFCRPLLELIVASHEPLDLEDAERILGWKNKNIKSEILDSFGTLLTKIENKIFPFHKSLLDWLTDPNSEASPYSIQISAGNERFASNGWNEYLHDISLLSDYNRRYLPHHLVDSKRFDDLRHVITNPDFFNILWDADQFNIRDLVSKLVKHFGITVLDLYSSVLTNPDEYSPDYVYHIARLLTEAGNREEAISLLENMALRFYQNSDFSNLIATLGDLGSSFIDMDMNEKAEKIFKELELISRKIEYARGLQMALGHRGTILVKKGDLDGALHFFNEQEKICRSQGDPYWLQISLGNQGNVYYQQNQLERSLKKYEEKERLCRENGNFIGLQSALGGQGNVYASIGDLDHALNLYNQCEILNRRIGNKTGIQRAVGAQGTVHYKKGNLIRAIDCYKVQEGICREIHDNEGIYLSLYNRALIHEETGEIEHAFELFREQAEICREINDLTGLQHALGALGDIYYKKGNLMEAGSLYNEQMSIVQNLGSLEDLHRIIGNKGLVEEALGNFQIARAHYLKKETIARDIKDDFAIQYALSMCADLAYKLGNTDNASLLYKKQEKICREGDLPAGLLFSLQAQAEILLNEGSLDNANKLYNEIINSYKGPCEHVLGVMGAISLIKGEIETAERIFIQQEAACLKTNNYWYLVISLLNRAFILKIKGENDRAEQLCSEYTGYLNDIDWRGIITSQLIRYKMFDSLDRLFSLLQNYNICHTFKPIQSPIKLSTNHFHFQQIHSILSSGFSRMENICREMAYPLGVQFALGKQGILQYLNGEMSLSYELFCEQERINRTIGFPSGTGMALGFKAKIALDRGDYEVAYGALQEMEQISREIKNIYGKIDALEGLGIIEFQKGKLADSLSYFKANENLCRRYGFVFSLFTPLLYQYQIHYKEERFQEADLILDSFEKISIDLKCLAGKSLVKRLRGNSSF